MHKPLAKLGLAIASTFWLTSCTSTLDDYKNTTPKFELSEYFDARSIAFGMLQDYSNQVTRRFCVEIEGSWQTQNGLSQGQLDETFYFDDGEISKRLWRLQQQKDGSYVGTADDVVGQASGKSVGMAFHWQYELDVAVGDSNYVFTLDDWIYQLDEHRLLNKTKMKKFSLQVAEITIFFDKQTPFKNCPGNKDSVPTV